MSSCCGGGAYRVSDDVLQLGDGSMTDRSTPVAVAGLSSGVAMVALGYVRLVASAACLVLV